MVAHHRKSDELIIAQGATFASHGGEWTPLEKQEIFRQTTRAKGRRLAQYCMGYEDYLLWLSSLSSQERLYIQRKAGLQQAYSHFEEPIANLRHDVPYDLSGWDNYESHSAYVGDDCMSVSMRLVHDGIPYVVRFMNIYNHNYRVAQVDTEYYVDALVRCVGEAGTEQLVACSYEYCNTVCHELHGVDCRQLTLQQPISPSHLFNVVQTQQRLHELEVNTGAIMLYDPDCGFNFSGMFTSMPDARPLQPMVQRIKRLIYAIGGAKRYDAPPSEDDAHFRLQTLEDLQLVISKTQDEQTQAACASAFYVTHEALLPHVRTMV